MTKEQQIRLGNIADTHYEIFALLKQRYSPRIFSKATLKRVHIRQLFEAVRWSASSSNLQPWRFIYGEKDTEAHKKIVECLTDDNRKWATKAPLLLLSAYKEEKDNGDKNFHALHDLGLSLGNMTVQAQYLGIALHHMAGLDWKKAQRLFDVPGGYHITTAIAVGYYGGDFSDLPEGLQKKETAERKRMDQSEFAFENGWKV